MNATATNPFLEAALAYARQGWPVFPCHPSPDKPKSKSPLLPKESAPGAKDGGFYLATTDEEQIRAWWKRWPMALIGLRTGKQSKVLVLDLDPREHAADTMLRGIADFCGGALPPCPVVRTQSGGLHLYFAHPDLEDMGNAERIARNNLFKQIDGVAPEIVLHVDVRGEGGYVIVPPSTMEDGKVYGWEVEPDEVGLPPVPARLLDAMLRRGEFGRGGSSPAPSSQPAPEAPPSNDPVREAIKRYGLAAYAKEIDALSACQKGARGSELNRTGFSLGQLVGAGALSRSVAAAGLREACNRNGLAAVDGWPKTEATIERSLSAGERQPRDLSDVERQTRERVTRKSSQGARIRPPQSRPKPSPAPSSRKEGGPQGEPSQTGGGVAGDEKGGTGERSLDHDLALLPPTDLANATRFLRRFGNKFIFVRDWGWLMWDGRRWARTGAEGALEDHIKTAIRQIEAEAEALRGTDDDVVVEVKRGDRVIRLSDRLDEWALTSQGAGHVSCIKGLVLSDLERPIGAFDSDPMRINVLNGTLIVSRHPEDTTVSCVELRPHDPADLITKLAPVAYDKAALCPTFDKFMDEVQPDADDDGGKPVQRFLDQWAGLSFTGDIGEQKLAFFYGKGRNGKGVWVETLKHVAGDYTETVPIETFLDQGRSKRGGEASPDLAILPGVRFLTTSEPEKGAKLAEGLIKLVTGGDTIKARHLNKDFFSFKPQFKLTMQGNYRPKIDGTDEGIWERMLLVPWRVFIPKERRDPMLVRKLQAEASGILNRLLAGLLDWLDNGLAIPDAVSEATAKYRSDSDPLGRFLAACTKHAEGKKVQSSELYRVFAAWAKANGEPEWSSTGFGRALRERGLPEKKSDVVWWLDLALIRSVDDFLDAHGDPIKNDGDE